MSNFIFKSVFITRHTYLYTATTMEEIMWINLSLINLCEKDFGETKIF